MRSNRTEITASFEAMVQSVQAEKLHFFRGNSLLGNKANLPPGIRHAPCSIAGQSQRATAMPSGRPESGTTLFMQGQGVFDMLVLSRKVGERIHVGDDVVLEIRRIAGNRVTLALDAPRYVRILRGELEGAAREFRTTGAPSGPAAPSVPVPARVAILDHIPVHSTAHNCAT